MQIVWAEVPALPPSEQDFEAGPAKVDQLVLPWSSWHRAVRLEMGKPVHGGIYVVISSCSSLTFRTFLVSDLLCFCILLRPKSQSL